MIELSDAEIAKAVSGYKGRGSERKARLGQATEGLRNAGRAGAQRPRPRYLCTEVLAGWPRCPVCPR
jgi:hypothetical protein